jgi:hypothetical protein
MLERPSCPLVRDGARTWTKGGVRQFFTQF